MLSLTKKIKYFIYICTALVLVLSFLVGRTFVINADEVKEKLNNWIETKTASCLSIETADGIALYSDSKFSDDSLTRLSTFHIVGDKNNGIVNSLITTQRKNVVIADKKKHQYFQNVDIKLTINSELQKDAYIALTNQQFANQGCIIVLDYKTGEIKAMTSIPALDVLSVDTIPDGAYINKALYAYVPGSVYKAVSVAAVLELHPEAKSFTYYCNSKSGHISCSYAHGQVTLEKALEKSCNCAISNLISTYITNSELEAFVSKVDLLSKEQIVDMTCNQKGNINAKADLKWTANGQGENLNTPISIAKYYATLANGGKLVPPHIMLDTQVESKQMISSQTCQFISTALEGVVGNSEIPCRSFAKTGTAQINDTESHSWYVCSLIDDNTPTYTVLCFLERGGTSLNAKDVTVGFINNYIL